MQIIAYIVLHLQFVVLVNMVMFNLLPMPICVYLVFHLILNVPHLHLNNVLQWVIRLLEVLVFYVLLVLLQIVLHFVCKMVFIIMVP